MTFTGRNRLGASAIVFCLLFTNPVTAAAGDEKEFKISGKRVPEIVASVNNTPLDSDLLRREWVAFNLMARQQGRKILPGDEKRIAGDLVSKMIDQELIFQKSRDLNIRIQPATIERELNQIQEQFPSKKLFLSALALQHLTLESLKINIEKQLSEEALIRREIAPNVTISDSLVEKYYRENIASYRKPETYRASHIFVATADPAQEGKAEDPGDQKKATWIINQLNASAKEIIREAHKNLKAGEKFESLVREYSEDEESRNKGGDLGTLHAANTPPGIVNLLPKMEVGQTSGVVQSPLGYHILKLTEKTPRWEIPLAEVKPNILNHLLKMGTLKLKRGYITKLRQKAKIKKFSLAGN